MAMTEAEYDEDQFLLQLGLAFSLSEGNLVKVKQFHCSDMCLYVFVHEPAR